MFRVERKERARLKNVKFSGKGSDPKVRCQEIYTTLYLIVSTNASLLSLDRLPELRTMSKSIQK